MNGRRTCPPGTMPYRIKAGDTFFGLAQKFDTTVPALVAANPGVDFNNLKIGQMICIPKQTNYPPCPEENYYRIRPGDTFYTIARRYNISLDDLLEANPGVNPDMLMIGQIICLPLAQPPLECPEGTEPYTVKAGDTFYSIAKKYNLTVDELIAANPGVNPDMLMIGQIICLPMVEPPLECPEGTEPYTIKAGDTFYSIAKKYNLTVDEIIAANPDVDPDMLKIGQIICLPMVEPPLECPEGTEPYIIKAGDTFYSIAKKYDITVDEIIAANPDVDPDMLKIGQTICIPS